MRATAPFPTEHQMTLVAAVAEHGGVSAAATALGISQPAVTAQLKKAESALRERLFVRTYRGLVPTAAGRAVAAFARRLEASRRSLVSSLRALSETDGGALVVGSSTTPGESWLPQRLSELRRKHPGADVRVVMGNSSETIARLESRAVDIAALGLAVRGRGLKCVEIGTDRIVAVAARGSRFAKGSLRPRSLADATFILREEGSATRRCALAGLKRIGITPSRLMPLASNEAVMRMAAAGLGIGMVSVHAASRLIDDGELARVRINGWKCRRHLYLARRADSKAPLVDELWTIAAKGGRSRGRESVR
jgi:DNA-binding transcriptional LysR family regulator